jgi:5-bromo-4-chloroindolyl phosphate hydrolysis protein
MENNTVWLILIVVFLVFVLTIRLRMQAKINYEYRQKLAKFQKQHQLSDSELKLFHDTMEEAKQLILRAEAATVKNKQLTKIEKEEFGIRSAKEIFKLMMEEPHEITHFGDFFYTKLPGMANACDHLVKIKADGVDTPEIKQASTLISETVQIISASITDDYEKIIQADSEDIARTKTMLEKTNG